jgi:hypothetical protein
MSDLTKSSMQNMDEKVVIQDSDDVSLRETRIISVTAHEVRVLTLKIDSKVVPILRLLYLICFLDRTNIANAKLAGLKKSLSMPSNGYNTCL